MFTYLILFSFLISSNVTTYYIGYECDDNSVNKTETGCKNILIEMPNIAECVNPDANNLENYIFDTKNGDIKRRHCNDFAKGGTKCTWSNGKCTDPSKDTSINIKLYDGVTHYTTENIIKNINPCDKQAQKKIFIEGLNREEFKGSPKYGFTVMQLVSLAIMNIPDTWPNSCLEISSNDKCSSAWRENIDKFYKKMPSPLNIYGNLEVEIETFENLYSEIGKAIDAVIPIINKGKVEEKEKEHLDNLLKIQKKFSQEPFIKTFYYEFFKSGFGTNNTPPAYKISGYKKEYTCVEIASDNNLYFDKDNKIKLNITNFDGFKTSSDPKEFDLALIAPYINELHKAKIEIQSYVHRLKIFKSFDPKSKNPWLARTFRSFREWGFSGDVAMNMLFDGVKYFLGRRDLKDALERQTDPCKYQLGDKGKEDIACLKSTPNAMTNYDLCVAILRNQNNPCEIERLNALASCFFDSDLIAHNYKLCVLGPKNQKNTRTATFSDSNMKSGSGSAPGSSEKPKEEEKKDDKKTPAAPAASGSSGLASNQFKVVSKDPKNLFPKTDTRNTSYTSDRNPITRFLGGQSSSKPIDPRSGEATNNTLAGIIPSATNDEFLSIQLIRDERFDKIIPVRIKN